MTEQPIAHPIFDWVMLSNFGVGDGGRETWAYNLLPLMLKAAPELEVRVFGLRTEGQPNNLPVLLAALPPEDRPRLKPHFFTGKRSRIPLVLPMLRQLRAYMKRRDVSAPTVVLAASSIAEQLVVLASRKLRGSYKIVWIRCLYFDEKSERIPKLLMPLARRIEAWLHGKADLLIANGDDIAAYYERYGLNVHVIRNGVDLARWYLSPPTVSAPLKIAFIGRLTGVKGFGEFLAAARRIKAAEDAAAFEFHVVGSEGPYQAEARAAADEGILAYHGTVPNAELPAMLAKIHVCVALTHAPDAGGGGGGTSNAMMEQMAAARILVAWDNRIFRQVLNDANAYLVPQGDVAALTAAFRAIVAEPSIAEARAGAAQESVRPFSNEAHLKRFAALLAEKQAPLTLAPPQQRTASNPSMKED